MSSYVNVDVHHITRTEGHGNLVLRARDGHIEKLEWQVPEAPRFFEAMVRGRHWQDIQTIVSRVCGICSVTHSLAAIRAIEDAMGFEVSDQVDTLRVLSHYGEHLESHSLHIGYLAAPDLAGIKSALPLASSNPDLLKTIIAIHRTANQWMALLCGRMTHPVSLRPGGLCRFPTETELRNLQQMLKAVLPQLDTLAEAVAELQHKLPRFERDTEYVALKQPGEYTFYHGDIASSDTEHTVPVQQFEQVANEYITPASTAKYARWHRASYATGALARFNLNAHDLLPHASKTANRLGLTAPCTNPFMNTVAQVVECVQVVEHGLQLIDLLLHMGIRPETPPEHPKAGAGVGCVEAPRGILFHKYAFDKNGICTDCNLCIPTNQNHANIQHDLEAFVPQILDQDQDAIRLQMEMLVRAYDPCISCSTHYLIVTFV